MLDLGRSKLFKLGTIGIVGESKRVPKREMRNDSK
jgi:hypothetical protein